MKEDIIALSKREVKRLRIIHMVMDGLRAYLCLPAGQVKA